MISLTFVNERAVACVVSISYDREVPGEDRRAKQCYDALLDSLTHAGYYSYRLGIQAGPIFDPDKPYGRLLSALKDAIDPNQILAPGRYLAQSTRMQLAEPADAAGATPHWNAFVISRCGETV